MASKCVANDENPFDGLKISEKWTNLRDVDERTICPKCNKSRKYFCYTCYIPVAEIKDYIPQIKLPVKVDIIKHSREIDGKSTAIHAAVLCPEDVTVYTYPSIPNYDIMEQTVLVFPSPNAKSVEELVENSNENHVSDQKLDSSAILRVVFIDSTWNQTRGIYKDPRIFKLPCVVLKNRITQFWRHQNGVPRWHLSTIEAIHQFFMEYDIVMIKLKNNRNLSNDRISNELKEESTTLEINSTSTVNGSCYGKYDNLLFFFRFMYDKIHTLYDHDSLKSYKRPLE